jgi:hypothetical protein
MNKRDATIEETEKALQENCDRWNMNNPSFEHDIDFWKSKQLEAEAEGYKSEVCSCGVVFLAFHHYCSCTVSNCPMSDGVTLLDRLIKLNDEI